MLHCECVLRMFHTAGIDSVALFPASLLQRKPTWVMQILCPEVDSFKHDVLSTERHSSHHPIIENDGIHHWHGSIYFCGRTEEMKAAVDICSKSSAEKRHCQRETNVLYLIFIFVNWEDKVTLSCLHLESAWKCLAWQYACIFPSGNMCS